MGMYTEFVYAIDLRENTPQEVIDLLNYMTNTGDNCDEIEIPKHELFGDTRWRHMLKCDSAYFLGKSSVHFSKYSYMNEYNLTVRTNFKNYDDEITLFLDWIKPYVSACCDEFLGYYRYEEDIDPTLIYWDGLKHYAKQQ